ILYCHCQTPYDASRFMIACDQCDQWYHGDCIDFTERESELMESYICSCCTESKFSRRKETPHARSVSYRMSRDRQDDLMEGRVQERPRADGEGRLQWTGSVLS
ncbi:hypothetical protein BDF14DRAFT_1735288, partial [Spinellus fusiger]